MKELRAKNIRVKFDNRDTHKPAGNLTNMNLRSSSSYCNRDLRILKTTLWKLREGIL